MTNISPSIKGKGGRPASKFTPQAIEKIKELVAQGAIRDEIANLLGVTVGSLQVTCSKLGVSLRRTSQNGSASCRRGNGRSNPVPGSAGVVREEQSTEEVSIAVKIRHQ